MEMMRRNILENGLYFKLVCLIKFLFFYFILFRFISFKDNEDDFVFAQDQNSQFLGMFEYKHQNESLILKILISGKKEIFKKKRIFN